MEAFLQPLRSFPVAFPPPVGRRAQGWARRRGGRRVGGRRSLLKVCTAPFADAIGGSRCTMPPGVSPVALPPSMGAAGRRAMGRGGAPSRKQARRCLGQMASCLPRQLPGNVPRCTRYDAVCNSSPIPITGRGTGCGPGCAVGPVQWRTGRVLCHSPRRLSEGQRPSVMARERHGGGVAILILRLPDGLLRGLALRRAEAGGEVGLEAAASKGEAVSVGVE